MRELQETTPIDELKFSSGKENTLKTFMRMVMRQIHLPKEHQPPQEELDVQKDIGDSLIEM